MAYEVDRGAAGSFAFALMNAYSRVGRLYDSAACLNISVAFA
jgi:hypothetical protein